MSCHCFCSFHINGKGIVQLKMKILSLFNHRAIPNQSCMLLFFIYFFLTLTVFFYQWFIIWSFGPLFVHPCLFSPTQLPYYFLCSHMWLFLYWTRSWRFCCVLNIYKWFLSMYNFHFKMVVIFRQKVHSATETLECILYTEYK